ncbi:unnamed protein product [Sphagnum tenellum]
MRRPQRTEFLQQQRTLSRCISHDKIRISIALWEEEEESSSNSRDSLPRNKIKSFDRILPGPTFKSFGRWPNRISSSLILE